MLSNEYIAGFFDGEGCIGIYPRRGGSSFQLIVRIGQNYSPVLEMIQEKFGGQLYMHSNNRQYSLQLGSQRAAYLLRKLSPYLVVKKPQAEIALAFQDHVDHGGGATITDYDYQERLWFLREIKRLKNEVIDQGGELSEV